MKIKKDAFQLIIACTCKEETALYPGVGVYHSVRYVLFWTRAGMVRTDVRPTVVPLVNISFNFVLYFNETSDKSAHYLWHHAHVHPGM